jgi:hypothetical protein
VSTRAAFVSLYAPIWVDNRTGFDLVFRDLDVPALLERLSPFLCACVRECVCVSWCLLLWGALCKSWGALFKVEGLL